MVRPRSRSPCGSVDRNQLCTLRAARKRVAPRAGAWIETTLTKRLLWAFVAPRAGAWIETCAALELLQHLYRSLPVRERGSKPRPRNIDGLAPVAPRAGAWIETVTETVHGDSDTSLPVRERGSKRCAIAIRLCRLCRSPCGSVDRNYLCRYWATGICRSPCGSVDRNIIRCCRLGAGTSLPVRERGSKHLASYYCLGTQRRSPCGSVDRNPNVERHRVHVRSLPVRERGSKRRVAIAALPLASLPVRERGSKPCKTERRSTHARRSPCGSVDRNNGCGC